MFLQFFYKTLYQVFVFRVDCVHSPPHQDFTSSPTFLLYIMYTIFITIVVVQVFIWYHNDNQY